MPLKIGWVEFLHHVFCAPGARGFFGEGYLYSRYFAHLGLTWDGTNLAARTTPFFPRMGNMPLGDNGITPRELIPRCIVINPLNASVLNAVGWSSPGVVKLLEMNRWQQIVDSFVLSIGTVGLDEKERREEYVRFRDLLEPRMAEFKSSFALHVACGCPNIGHNLAELQAEIIDMLRILHPLGLPLVPNFDPLVPVELLLRIQDSGLASAFWLANTIIYEHDGLGKRLFYRAQSPLIGRGFSGGGISSPACLPYTLKVVEEARRAGIILPIIAGNGIQSTEAVEKCHSAGASAIAIGAVAMVRPWRMRSIIQTANTLFDGKGH